MARPTPVLKSFDIVVYKDKDPTAVPPDRAQIPAGGATIDFYAQGATASAAKTIPKNGAQDTVNVFHPGLLRVTTPVQTVQIDGNATIVLQVIDVVLAGLGAGAFVTLKNTSTTDDAVIAVGSRLILLSDRPKIYSDPAAPASASGSTQATAGADGRVRGYLRDYRFDYIVTIDAATKRVYADAEGSFVMR